MILVAVIIGYILGVAPSIYKEIKEIIENKQAIANEKKEEIDAQELLDEWLNGPKETVKTETTEVENNNINQADIYNEYITGKVTDKEG